MQRDPEDPTPYIVVMTFIACVGLALILFFGEKVGG